MITRIFLNMTSDWLSTILGIMMIYKTSMHFGFRCNTFKGIRILIPSCQWITSAKKRVSCTLCYLPGIVAIIAIFTASETPLKSQHITFGWHPKERKINVKSMLQDRHYMGNSLKIPPRTIGNMPSIWSIVATMAWRYRMILAKHI